MKESSGAGRGAPASSPRAARPCGILRAPMRLRDLASLAALLAACGTTATGAPDVLTAADAVTPRDVPDATVATDVTDATDVIAPQDVPTPLDAPSGCTGSAPPCVSGTAGGACGDALSPATCARDAWRCPTGMVFVSQCACVGRPPGNCTCGPSGWVCDAGAPDAGDAVDCDPSHVLCNRIPPTCTGGGEVPSVVDRCWGPCVVFTRCAPIACDPDAPASQCPMNMVCYRTTRMCGPFL